jgi:glycosyltransferase involved in cell wall biosynthesis
MSTVRHNRRILFVDEDPGRTGSTVSLEYLLRGFRSGGYEVFVLTLKRDPVFLARLAENARVIEMRGWKMNSLGLNLYFTNTVPVFSFRGMVVMVKEVAKFLILLGVVFRVIRETRVDLVYANEYVLVAAYVAASLRRIPLVVHVRSRFITGSFGLRRAVISRLVPLCSRAVIAITGIEAGQLRPMKRHRSRINIIGEFVGGEHTGGEGKSASRFRDRLNLTPGEKIVAMLGGIMTIKGTLDFVRAAARISGKRPEVVFVIAGRIYREETAEAGLYYEECLKAAGDMPQRGRLRILGEITDAADLIAASVILVSPSPETHFSRPVVEAWEMSKPVVAVRTEHMRELISDGIDGFLVDAGDESALAAVLLRLLDDAELCSRVGREGKRKAEKLFNADTNLQKILGICEHL